MVTMYLIMVVVGCKLGGFLAEGKTTSGSDRPVDNAALDNADAIKFHEQEEDAVCHPP